MNKTLKKLTILVVVSLAVIGGIWGGLFATTSAENHDEAAIKAEVEAAVRQLVQALNTSDGVLFDSLWLHSDKTTFIPVLQPFRVDGWPEVRQPFAGLLSLPPGAVSLVLRQLRIDLLGDEAALGTGHFIITIRPPGGAPITINGRTTVVLEKVDGKWLRVHTHGSALP